MPHFFINSNNIIKDCILVNDSDNYNHIVRSLRTKVGEPLLFVDDNEIEYEATVEEITNKELKAKINKKYKSVRKLPFNLYLAQSPLRSDAQSVIIEKATELGAAGVYPVYTDNCALNKSVIDKKITKWQRTMYEASKQCERANIPVCYELNTIYTLLKTRNFDFVFAFCERNADMTFREFYNLNKSMFSKGNDILVIIGPEGGFSKTEFEYFAQHSIPMLTLGDLILKAETAVIVAIGNIIYEYNYSK